MISIARMFAKRTECVRQFTREIGQLLDKNVYAEALQDTC